MNAELQPPRFQGLRLALGHDDAASVLGRILGLDAAPLLLLDQQWIEVSAAPGDALDFRCDDLDTRRTHLRRLGIEALDGAALGCTPCLRLDAIDTGACTVDLREGAAGPGGAPLAQVASARLCALELAVRAPERIAMHWSQMFNASTSRDGRGMPTLALDGLDLRFAPPAEGRLGVTALEFATSEVDAWAHRASAQGFKVDDGTHHAAFGALGVAFRLRDL